MKFFPKIGTSFNIGCLFFMFFVFLVLPVGVFSETTSFYRSLGIGSKGLDVLFLQQFLNSDPDTMVAFSGAGSPGFETDRFGSLTRLAVNKFQKKYSDEILFAGQAPTGYVGPKTLRKLNLIFKDSQGAPPGVSLDKSSFQNVSEKGIPKTETAVIAPAPALPEVSSVSPELLRSGDAVSIRGKNFSSSGNTVFLRYGALLETFPELRSNDGNFLSFIFKPNSSFVANVLLLEKTLHKEDWQTLVADLSESGLSLDDIKSEYQGISSREELDKALQDAGGSMLDFNEPYIMTVLNGFGQSQSVTVMVEREIRLGQ